LRSTLIVGYGNPDREDDGIAWHILYETAKRLGRPLPDGPEEGFFPSGENPDFWFDMQLAPDMAEDLARYERICFVDAHTGDIPHEILMRPVDDTPASSAFTHHMTAATCLALVRSLYGRSPEAMLLSVRGYRFGFHRELSPQAAGLLEDALKTLDEWMNKAP
jgi:hydrogenase maturation protease